MVKESQTKRFCSCIKKVRSTLKQRKGSGAIAICVTSVLQKHGRTLKKFRCKGKKARVITQRQTGGGRVVFLADNIHDHERDLEKRISVLLITPQGPLILKPGDKVKNVHDLKDTNSPSEEILTYVTATFKADRRHGRGRPPIITKLHFSDDRGIMDRVYEHTFDDLVKTIQLVKMENLHLSPVSGLHLSPLSESISMSVSKSRSRSKSRSH